MVLYEKGGDVAEKETEVKTPAKRSAGKSGYDAEAHADAIREELAVLATEDPETLGDERAGDRQAGARLP